MAKNLEEARQIGENPIRINDWFDRMTGRITHELQANGWMSFERFRDDFTRWWHYDEKGCIQDADNVDKKVVLCPVYHRRPHGRSSGKRYWFTVIVFCIE